MIIFFLSETTSANTSALEYIGIFLIRAYCTSLLLFLIADDLTSIVAFFTFFLEWPIKTFIPDFKQLIVFLFLFLIAALNFKTHIFHNLSQSAHSNSTYSNKMDNFFIS